MNDTTVSDTTLTLVVKDAKRLPMEKYKEILVELGLYSWDELLSGPYLGDILSKHELVMTTLKDSGAQLDILKAVHREREFSDNTLRALVMEGIELENSIDGELAEPVVEPGRKEISRILISAALLIGVGAYTHHRFASLPATVRDAQAIAAVLTDPARCGYPPANVQTITGPDATAANIRAALESLSQSTNSQSTVLVYFSGHGGRALENGVWRAYLCPREADPDDLAHTAIPGAEFSGLLAAVPARKLLVMLDACHAAGSASLKGADGALVWKAGLPDAYYEALSQGSGRVVIASSKEDQFSYVRPQGDLSLFTHHLRDALSGNAAVRGDGLIHVLDVFHYVNETVQADEPKQTPILKVKDLDLNFPIAVAPAQTGKAFETVDVLRESDKDDTAIRAKIKAIDKTLADLGAELERGFIDFGRYSRLKADWERQKAELEAQPGKAVG